jgi:hypothetical protein
MRLRMRGEVANGGQQEGGCEDETESTGGDLVAVERRMMARFTKLDTKLKTLTKDVNRLIKVAQGLANILQQAMVHRDGESERDRESRVLAG